MTEPAAYRPPPPCGMSDVARWRAVVAAGRMLGGRPKASVPGLKKTLKEASTKATLPYAHNNNGSVFVRLIRQLRAWPSVAPEDRPARAADLRALAEAVAHELGDDHDPAEAGRMLNLTRPRADLDD